MELEVRNMRERMTRYYEKMYRVNIRRMVRMVAYHRRIAI